MSQLRVLIVGASIAGPMTAYWLAKPGAKVTVIEHFPGLRTNGQAIDIRTTGVTIMRKIPGMEEAVSAKSTELEGMSIVDTDGRSYGTIRASGNPDQQTLLSEYEIFRGDLGKILFDLTRESENVRYVFGERIASIHYRDGGEDGPATVEFMKGFETAGFDLIVACDGATSRTRVMGFGGSDRDYVHPVNSWAAYFSIDKDLIGDSGHRVLLMSVQPRDKPDLGIPFQEAMKNGDDELKRYIARRYEGSGWKTEDVMPAMMDSRDFYANEMVQVKVPTLYRGRIVLVGDAEYAPGPTGTGTTLAMTGAYVLAGEMMKHQGDLGAGFKVYEERMRPIIDDIQKIPPFVQSIMAPQTTWGIWVKNNIFALIAWSNLLEYAQKLFGGSAASTDKYGLSEYTWGP